MCRNPSLTLTTKARACKSAGQKGSPRGTSYTPESAKECEGVPRQNVISMLVPWPLIEYTIRGKVVASLKFELWWILWVQVCSWLVLTLKVLKLCTNQLVVWFMRVHVNNWHLSLFLVPIPEFQHAPLPLKCCELGSVPQLLTFLLFSL
jgi:hypothetical protein